LLLQEFIDQHSKLPCVLMYIVTYGESTSPTKKKITLAGDKVSFFRFKWTYKLVIRVVTSLEEITKMRFSYEFRGNIEKK